MKTKEGNVRCWIATDPVTTAQALAPTPCEAVLALEELLDIPKLYIGSIHITL